MMELRQEGPVSERKVILLKGYQNWAGRALVGLRSLSRCADLLKEYRIVIFSASSEVEMAATLFSQDTGISVEVLPISDNYELLRWHGRARIYIGLNITDGISISSLEAILMGAFPIQSNGGCSNEWIVNGINGFIVPPEDPDVIVEVIREAVLNNALVDSADEFNKKLALERLDENVVKPQVVEMYKHILAEKRG
jgi:glycosyltransferase involved in cell wall biosynthesis